MNRCRLHHKDTNFKANHNSSVLMLIGIGDVDCTTKIRILKQITTLSMIQGQPLWMSIAPQRYEF